MYIKVVDRKGGQTNVSTAYLRTAESGDQNLAGCLACLPKWLRCLFAFVPAVLIQTLRTPGPPHFSPAAPVHVMSH